MDYRNLVNKINSKLPEIFYSSDNFLSLSYSTNTDAEVVELNINECTITVYNNLDDFCQTEDEFINLLVERVTEIIKILGDFKNWIDEY